MRDFRTKYIYFLSALIFITALGLLSWFASQYYGQLKNTNADSLSDVNNSQIQNCNYRRVLDGVCVDSADKINPPLVAVMIENHVDARPQSGLSKASIVYEAPVEANYTRFLAIYSADEQVIKVGPVRSARPYYLDWLSEYGNLPYLHCGGSPEALEKIKSNMIFDLNEFYNGKYYWRDGSRSAPHNVYTSSELWNKALANEQQTTSNEQGNWIFDTTTSPHHNIIASQITVSFLPPVYEAVWKFNSSTLQYERYQMGEKHLDQDGSAIVADDVIVQKVRTQVLDEIGRLKLTNIGKGEALVFINGEMIKGYWQKDNTSSRTRFYNDNDEEIKLKPGKIWIEAVNQSGSISF